MRVFVTGASGWVGSVAVRELLSAGHQVVALARSDRAAAAVAEPGVDVIRGDLDDLESLRSGAKAADGVVHLAYHHDFSQMDKAARMDLDAIAAFGDVLEGTDRPLVIAAGTLGLAADRTATERDTGDPRAHPRVANAQAALELAARGVRSSVVRFAPSVHGEGDYGLVPALIEFARTTGVSAYIGDGANRWPAVHRLDAATLVRLAVDEAPAGSTLHAVAEEGVPTRAIAEAVGRGLGLPVASISTEQAAEHFGWLGRFFSADCPASSALTRELLDWRPTHHGLIEDLEEGHYFGAAGR
ncbi:SDR family oxidoreductase [Pseudonocardia spinosispora]|uniref:SDR family oxidoreductase n=1 Tax=Pseudonocardia spinosispora TaxID=103441 RepID=UPI00041F7597|nr:SDR family oxidoreductase [Pseudonocardia spinosispora]